MAKSVLELINNYSEEEIENILNENHITYKTYPIVGGKVDKSRTHLNYSFVNRSEEWRDKRLEELGFGENDKCIGSTVFRLPKDYVGDEVEFFEFIFTTIQNDVGKENMIGAMVHKDQKIPHIHLAYIIVEEAKGGTEN